MSESRSDIEIARAADKKPITEIGARLGIPAAELLPYGHDKAKVSAGFIRSLADRPAGRLVLVTAINPTPAGEGKTTTTVGLGDGLNRIGKKTMICLREQGVEVRRLPDEVLARLKEVAAEVVDASAKADPVAAAMLSAALRTCALALGKPDAGKEPSARIKLAWAAVMCGLGTDSAGGALASALGHASGTIAGTTNGLVNAIVLPEALRFNRAAIGASIPEIAHALDVGDAAAGLDQIIDILRSIFHGLGVPMRLRELPMPRELLPGIAAEAMDDWSLVTNPRPVAEIASLQEVLEAVW